MDNETMTLGKAYVRHQGACAARIYAPLAAGDGLCERSCAACDERFVPGDRLALVALGPGESHGGREKARAGQAYNAVAVAVHAACAGLDTEAFAAP